MQQTSHSFARIRALDGLRGLAVAGVLAYHAGFDWARGGFLGVSLFFTLSGFLITSLLLAERSGTGRIALGAFWVRRARRLLPAATLALAGIVVFGATVATESQLRDLRGDVLGALGYVANWRFVLAGSSYGDLWGSPSPVQHFWSLAIEEQLYLVLPLLVVGGLALGRGSRKPVAALLTLGLAGSVVATFLVDDQLRAYYGTDVRAAELLAGALLAVVVAARPASMSRLAPFGAPALAALLLAWSTTTQSDPALYRGGFLLHAALVVVVIVAARGESWFTVVLSVRPLRWLGRISYGAYLYHWPIFLWLTEARTGLEGVPLAVLRLGVSLALAEVSVRFFEEPVRRGERILPGRAPYALAGAALAVSLSLVAVTTSVPEPAVGMDFTTAPSLVGPSSLVSSFDAEEPPLPPAPSSPTTTAVIPGPEVFTPAVPRAPGEPLRIYVAGDSNAYILGMKMFDWGEENDVQVWASGWFACHIVPGGTYRWAGEPKHTESQCNDWKTQREREIAKIRPHVVLLVYGSFDLLDRQWDGSDEWTHIGRPDFDAALVDNIELMTDTLAYGGARVVWATYPRTVTGVRDGIWPEEWHPETAEYRVARLNTFIRQVVARRPYAQVLDLRRFMQTWPGGELDPELRPDGIHPSEEMATLTGEWLARQLVAIAER